MKKIISSVCSILFILFFSVSAFAASPWAEGETYYQKFDGKFSYGMKNLLVGWTEVISQPLIYHKEKQGNRFSRFFQGLGRGAFNAVFDTLGGFVHLVTSPITVLDVPLPQGGVDLQMLTGSNYGNSYPSEYVASKPKG